MLLCKFGDLVSSQAPSVEDGARDRRQRAGGLQSDNTLLHYSPTIQNTHTHNLHSYNQYYARVSGSKPMSPVTSLVYFYRACRGRWRTGPSPARRMPQPPAARRPRRRAGGSTRALSGAPRSERTQPSPRRLATWEGGPLREGATHEGYISASAEHANVSETSRDLGGAGRAECAGEIFATLWMGGPDWSSRGGAGPRGCDAVGPAREGAGGP